MFVLIRKETIVVKTSYASFVQVVFFVIIEDNARRQTGCHFTSRQNEPGDQIEVNIIIILQTFVMELNPLHTSHTQIRPCPNGRFQPRLRLDLHVIMR